MGYFSGKYSSEFQAENINQTFNSKFLLVSIQVYYVMELQQNKYQKKTRSNGSRVSKKESYV